VVGQLGAEQFPHFLTMVQELPTLPPKRSNVDLHPLSPWADADGYGEFARAILAEHRDNLPETENVSLVSRLVGGGASLQPTLLCQ
jgi:hypothetical protein